MGHEGVKKKKKNADKILRNMFRRVPWQPKGKREVMEWALGRNRGRDGTSKPKTGKERQELPGRSAD